MAGKIEHLQSKVNQKWLEKLNICDRIIQLIKKDKLWKKVENLRSNYLKQKPDSWMGGWVGGGR